MVRCTTSTAPYTVKNVIYDFNKGMYAYLNDVTVGGFKAMANRAPQRARDGCLRLVVARETQR
jgi:hypothetical protein